MFHLYEVYGKSSILNPGGFLSGNSTSFKGTIFLKKVSEKASRLALQILYTQAAQERRS